MHPIFWALCICTASLPSRSQPVDWGTLNVPSRAPLIDARLSLHGGRTSSLPKGHFEAGLTVSHVNTWAQMPHYFFDGEFTRLDLSLARGLGRGRELWLTTTVHRRSGGFLDSFIERFHSAFGITQARRDRYAKNRLRVETQDTQGNWQTQLSQQEQGVGLGRPTLGFRQQLTRDGFYPTLSVDGCIQLPLGDAGRKFATRGIALGGRAAIDAPLGRRVKMTLAYGLVVSPVIRHFLGVPLTEVQKALMVALSWRPSPRWLVIFQYLNHDGISENARFAPLNLTTHEFALGTKWAPWPRSSWVFEAGLIENTVHDANTPDFGLFAGSRVLL